MVVINSPSLFRFPLVNSVFYFFKDYQNRLARISAQMDRIHSSRESNFTILTHAGLGNKYNIVINATIPD